MVVEISRCYVEEVRFVLTKSVVSAESQTLSSFRTITKRHFFLSPLKEPRNGQSFLSFGPVNWHVGQSGCVEVSPPKCLIVSSKAGEI